MPEVFRVGSLVFHFYSDEGFEPPHVHVRRGSTRADAAGKWWLSPVACVYCIGFKAAERRRIHSLIIERRQEILDAWNRHFGH